MQHNEDYVLKVLQEVGLVTRKQIESARTRLNGAGLDSTSDTNSNSPKYTAASLYLYEQISGDTDANRVPEVKSYFAFKPNMLLPPPPSTSPVTGIRDPFGNSYGYSTMKASDPTKNGYNPTFDLWSTANSTDPNHWIKNW